MTTRHAAFKRGFDIVVALGGLLALLPLLVVIGVMVKVTSRGPVLFRQQRIGRHGILFRVAKFRTMVTNSECHGTVTKAGDARITRVGAVLRRLKLDELPQLWNVLLGQMSLVGPRPDVPGYADRLPPTQRRLLELRPGITGPATLFFRNEEELLASVDDPQRYNDEVIYPAKVTINLAYVDNWSFRTDLCCILATVFPSLTRRLLELPPALTVGKGAAGGGNVELTEPRNSGKQAERY